MSTEQDQAAMLPRPSSGPELSGYTFDSYESEVSQWAAYPNAGGNLVYPALGLVGEAGEVAEKVKKQWRNKGRMAAAYLSADEKGQLAKEVGDVLWYAAAMARELGFTFAQIAAMNSAKLRDRAARNVIKSEGDNR